MEKSNEVISSECHAESMQKSISNLHHITYKGIARSLFFFTSIFAEVIYDCHTM